jgi:hypothetical protein
MSGITIPRRISASPAMSSPGDRLLDEREVVGREPADDGHRLLPRQALVEVYAQRHPRPHRRPHRRHALDPRRAGARHLDLRGGEAAAHPVHRLAGRLLRLHGADPRVERDLVAHPAPEQRVDGEPDRAPLQVAQGHLDGGLGLVALRHGSVHDGEGMAEVEGIEAKQPGRQPDDGLADLLRRHEGVAGRRVHVAPALGALVRGHAHEDAPLDGGGAVHAGHRPAHGDVDDHGLDGDDSHG